MDKFIMYSGSTLYGTRTPISDIDIRGWYIPPYEILLGRPHLGDDLTTKLNDGVPPSKDREIWTIQRYFQLLEKGSPIAIESLFCPKDMIIKDCWQAELIRSNSELFLTDRMVKSFFGYATGQWQEYLRTFNTKSASSSIRILTELWELLDNKQILFPNILALNLIDIKLGKVKISDISELYEIVLAKCQLAEKRSSFKSIEMSKINALYFECIADSMNRFCWTSHAKLGT